MAGEPGVAVNIVDQNGNIITSFGSGGTVTSVALTASGLFVVTGSPITSNGTLNFDWATETANLVLAGPTSGPAAKPTFRALVAADLPALGGLVVASAHLSAQSGSVSPVLTYTPSVDTTLAVQAHILITNAGTAATLACQCTWTDEGGTSRLLNMAFGQGGSATTVISILTAGGTVPFYGYSEMLRAKGGTTLTFATVSTGTPATYDISIVVYSLFS